MPAASARGRSAPAGFLSIGQVLARLTPEFPQLSTSKLRFLEVQGIVTPVRTDSGYRKFSPADLDRLRLALSLQRDRYLPLSVIRVYLDDLDAGREPAPPAALPSMSAPARRYRRGDLLTETGAAPQLFAEAVASGVLAAAETYEEEALALLRTLVALERHGIEPRHLRLVRQSAEREVDLIASALAPVLRRHDAASRARAAEAAAELSRRLDEVRALFARAALDRLSG